ncbi:metal ABC transporter ATP-binding protein [Salipaludibacillus sp. CF4.18]|uniref:metal ABC transporter ATP-binding protein n=1 Tax=Salipaludibacillus sp. CF4.18 TaxID=3373081 RepID=UPI003EE5CE5D
MTAINVKGLYVSYFGNEAINNISFQTNTGTILGIIGPNGAGKSTLLKSLLRLIPTDRGVIEYYGKPLKESRNKIAYVPQRSDIDWDFPITVLDTVVIGTYPKLGLFKRPKQKEREWAYHCLEKVGMSDFGKRQIGELSGGQQQRVFLARALAQETEMLFLDEPFVGIDASSEQTIITILRELRNLGKTIVIVHHDLNKAASYFDEILLINKELVSYGKAQDVLKPDNITKAYSGQLSFLKELGVNLS